MCLGIKTDQDLKKINKIWGNGRGDYVLSNSDKQYPAQLTLKYK